MRMLAKWYTKNLFVYPGQKKRASFGYYMTKKNKNIVPSLLKLH